MQHVTRYLSENPKFIKDFKFWLMREKKKASAKNCCSGAFITKYSCWEGTLNLERTIIFYEWSNLNGNKKFFNKVKDFYDFLEESKIKFPDYSIRKLIEDNEVMYFTCIPGKADLIASINFKGLEEALKKLQS